MKSETNVLQEHITTSGTPEDYTEDIYRFYFEVGEHDELVLNIITMNLGEHRSASIIKLPYGYELYLPIQCVPDIARRLCEENIAIYQIVRHEKVAPI